MISLTYPKSVFVGLTLLSTVFVSVSGSAEEAPPTPPTPVAPPTPTTAVPEAKPRFVFALSTDKPKYAAGEQVMLNVAITNNSKGPLLVSTDNLMRDFDLKVTDAQGRDVPLTTYGTFLTSPAHLKASKRRAGGLRGSVALSGVTTTLSFPINGFFDVSSTNTYTVSATQQGLGELQDGKPTALTAKATFQVAGISITKTEVREVSADEVWRRFSESGVR